MIDVLTTVWTPTAVGVAVGAGFALGFLFLGYLGGLPTYASEATPAEVFRVVVAGACLAGAVFYLGQSLVDPTAADRVVSRFGLWVVYSITMAFGTFLRLSIDDALRARRHTTTAREAVASDVADVAARQSADVGSEETDRKEEAR